MRLSLCAFALIAVAFSAACKDEGTIKVHRLSFKGVAAVRKLAGQGPGGAKDAGGEQ